MCQREGRKHADAFVLSVSDACVLSVSGTMRSLKEDLATFISQQESSQESGSKGIEVGASEVLVGSSTTELICAAILCFLAPGVRFSA